MVEIPQTVIVIQRTSVASYMSCPQKFGRKEDHLPSGYVNSLLLNMTIYFVDFPIKHGGSVHSYVSPRGY